MLKRIRLVFMVLLMMILLGGVAPMAEANNDKLYWQVREVVDTHGVDGVFVQGDLRIVRETNPRIPGQESLIVVWQGRYTAVWRNQELVSIRRGRWVGQVRRLAR